MVIWPEASKAQNNMAAVSAEGSTVWVLIRRLNSSCRRSIAFDVRIDFHWLIGDRAAFQPPFADERLALRRDLRLRVGVDHIVVIGGDFLVQPVGRVGEKIAMLVHRAALDWHVAPERGKSFLEALRAIDDDE